MNLLKLGAFLITHFYHLWLEHFLDTSLNYFTICHLPLDIKLFHQNQFSAKIHKPIFLLQCFAKVFYEIFILEIFFH